MLMFTPWFPLVMKGISLDGQEAWSSGVFY